ncbi:hypothetical protein DAPPUDRAFT_242836 [Daphnia pulex]|uniref:Uncharacterized protein n=1 Tax=Daphnia pulex TaxID=6669 RepID=E9GHG5_DAPPU|nr:hypothetical protein DAPPUDRAFT_242836 [Daphnia pulex]|eukprot:EFX80845.1 hypothetical protein DAPPUDRAFT_242836 [Daphnia pulex]
MLIRDVMILLVTGMSLTAAGSLSTFHKKRLVNLNGVRLKFAATHLNPSCPSN